jgi:protein gp37
MGDLFHKDVHRQDIVHIWNVMARNPQHIFQILTKRTDRMLYFLDWIKGQVPFDVWPLPNVHLGVTAENQERANERIPLLLQTPAAKRFISIEPMLGPISLNLATACDLNCNEHQEAWCPGTTGKCICQMDLNQVIVGSETGPGKRPMNLDWARDIRDQCQSADVPFFFKKDSDRKRQLDGKIWEELPEYSQVRALVAGITEGKEV